MRLSTGEKILYSGRDNLHMQGVAIMINQEIAKALIDWSPTNERITKARFYSKFIKLMMCMHQLTITDEETKQDFFENLEGSRRAGTQT